MSFFFVLCLLFALAGGPSPLSAQTFEQPFSSTSIWKLPIASGATYVSGGFSASVQINFAFENIGMHKVVASNPTRNVYRKTSNAYCADNIYTATIYFTVPLPNSLVVDGLASNGLWAFVFPDGQIIESYLWQRCAPSSEAAGRFGPSAWYPLTGNGIPSYGLGGSGMAALGGVMRSGELTTSAGTPIGHALKVILARKVLTYVASDPTPGYRWPALRADSGASTAYYGTNPEVEMGSLMAIRPTETESGLGLLTEPGKKIFHALQTYGGYVQDACCLDPDPSSWQAWMLGAELATDSIRTVEDQLQSTYGIDIGDLSAAPYSAQATANFKSDLNAIYNKLAVVSNATATNPKGPTTTPSVTAPTAPTNLIVE